MAKAKNERVLITGGAGFLGSVMTGHLLNEGYSVTCLDCLMYGQDSLLAYAANPNFQFVYGDVRDESLVKPLVAGADVIIPLAALVGMPLCEKRSEEAEAVNRDAVLLIEKLRGNGQKIIYPNTNSGYGTKSGEVYCTEETPLEPISVYGITKCEAEKALLGSDKGAVTFRLATVFGSSPRMRTDLLVNDFVLTALTEGEITLFERHFKRNYIHIRDIARLFAHAIEHYDEMKGRPYNAGLEEANLSKEELAEKVKEHIPGFQISFNEFAKDPDQRNYVVSNKRLLNTGFQTVHSLDRGIEELIKAYGLLLRNHAPQDLRQIPFTNNPL